MTPELLCTIFIIYFAILYAIGTCTRKILKRIKEMEKKIINEYTRN